MPFILHIFKAILSNGDNKVFEKKILYLSISIALLPPGNITI